MLHITPGQVESINGAINALVEVQEASPLFDKVYASDLELRKLREIVDDLFSVLASRMK